MEARERNILTAKHHVPVLLDVATSSSASLTWLILFIRVQMLFNFLGGELRNIIWHVPPAPVYHSCIVLVQQCPASDSHDYEVDLNKEGNY